MLDTALRSLVLVPEPSTEYLNPSANISSEQRTDSVAIEPPNNPVVIGVSSDSQPCGCQSTVSRLPGTTSATLAYSFHGGADWLFEEGAPHTSLGQSIPSSVSSQPQTQYTSINGTIYDMTAWQGSHIAILVPVQAVLDPQVMANLILAFDKGWEYYAKITGREPTPHFTYGGLGTIAVVQDTCGAGCGFLGFTGVEIIYDFFGAGLHGPFPWVVGTYNDMATNQRVQQIVFYELGRNFWFYGAPLGDWGFTTGFAVVNRYYAMLNTGFTLADEEGRFYHEQQLPVVAATYFADSSLTASNTLGANVGVTNPTGWNGQADLSASLLRIFREHVGETDYARFWQTLPSAPTATTAASSFGNFATVANQVTSFDFSFLFKTGWSFQVGTSGDDTITSSGSGNHAIMGFAGNDTLIGSSNSETLIGDYGNDTLLGNGGDDDLGGGAGNDQLQGGAGNDVLLGADGHDSLSGGSGVDTLNGGAGNDTFVDTRSSLSGDTIKDFSVGDRIVFTDATLGAFAFTLSGNTLTYSGGSLTLTGVTGTLIASVAAGGGVQLTLQGSSNPDARNDFNGDGRSDILWRDSSGAVTNSLGQANGGFAGNSTNFWATIPASWQVIGTGNFNSDDRSDLLWRNSTTGEITNWLGQPNGSFVGNDTNFYSTIPTSWQVVGIGDFNGDGRDDLLWRNGSTGQTTNWLAQPIGSFVGNDANALSTIGTTWQVAGIGDFNGDGRSDILWRENTGAMTTALGQANGGFAGNSANFWTTISTSWQIVGSGDFNGDGRDDILWRNPTTGEITNWLGQANGSFIGNDANFYTVIPTSWQVAGIGDFNGDGRDDLLWRNGSTGQTTDWLAQPNASYAGNDANALSTIATTWQVQPPPGLWG